MEQEEAARPERADSVQPAATTEAVGRTAPLPRVERTGLDHAVEQVGTVVREAKDASALYLVFLMALAVIGFSMFALWLYHGK